MSDQPKKGLGLFVSKRDEGAAAPAAAASSPPDPAAGGPLGLNPKNVKKRWLYVLVAVGGLAALASSLLTSPPPSSAPAKKTEPSISVTPRNVEERAWQAKSQTDITQLKAAVQSLGDRNEQLKKELLEMKTSKGAAASKDPLPAGVVPPPAPPTAGGSGSSATTLPPAVPPPPPLPPKDLTGGVLPSLPALPGETTRPLVFRPEPVKVAVAAPKSAAAGEEEMTRAKVTYAKNPYSGFLPAGAFAPVALLNGLDAGTGTTSQSNPQPVLMNVQEHATLPGSARYAVRNCFVLGSAYGDLSSERVYIRLAQLTCIDKRDRLVLSQQVQGYVVDSDGKLGLRGVLVDRQGAKLAKSMLAGFAQGLASAFGSAQGYTVTGPYGGTSNVINGTAALNQAALSGASTAAGQLAQFYLKEAQAMFPVITVDAGRLGSMVFTQGAALQWSSGETLYQKEVKPE